MLKLIDFKPEHAMEVIANGVIQPNLRFCDKVEPWAEALVEFPAKTGIYYSDKWPEGKIVGCGGMVILTENHRAEAWIIIIDDVIKLRIDHRLVRNQLYEWIIDNNIVRVEAPLRVDFKAGFRYARHLGFEHEAILKKYHPGGVDADMHVIIREDI